VLARDSVVVVQGAVELERLEEAAERRCVHPIRSRDHFTAAEVGADGIHDGLPRPLPVRRHLRKRSDLAERRDVLVVVAEDVPEHVDMKRPGVQEALRVLQAHEASALVVAKLDRLSRSMMDFTALMANAQKQSWALVALDCAVDTSTPTG
jgi:hypothetical protein